MFKFTSIRAALVTASFISLTLSIGARPQLLRSGIIGAPPQTLSVVLRDIGPGNETLPARDEPSYNNSESAEAADPIGSVSTFYSLRPDLRRCASPLCGGYFVKRVNQLPTRCAVGRSRSECYVAEIDWNGQPQVDTHKALLRGDVVARTYPRFGKLGVLVVRESWQAASDAGAARSDSYYRVKDRGVRCITHPCPTHHEAKLNTTTHRNIAGVDLSGAGARDDLVAQASAAMTGDGLPVVGSHVRVSGPGGKSFSLKATQFYLRAKGEQANKPCIKTGCSSQVCADEPMVTTCEWQPEYECYRTAKCERQANGRCGFTQTAQLKSCLARK